LPLWERANYVFDLLALVLIEQVGRSRAQPTSELVAADDADVAD